MALRRAWLLPLLLAATAALPLLVAAKRPTLRFSNDGTFKIIQLTDLHYGSLSFRDKRTTEVQTKVLEAEKEGMGLVVFSGDMVTGFMEYVDAALDKMVGSGGNQSGWFEQQWKKVVAPVHNLSLPYCITLGNHDAQADLDGRQIVQLDIDTGKHLTLTQQGPANITGASNYWLDVLASNSSAVAARIWVLDSGMKGCDGDNESWGCVAADTAQWVAETAATLPPVDTHIAYLHIPPIQVLEVWNNESTRGFKDEPSGCSQVDSGAFAALRDAGVQAIFFGHDHDNCFYGELDGVRVGYGRKTGVGNYGPPRDVARGARVVLLREGESAADAETWIRNEAGKREDDQPSDAENKVMFEQGECGTPNSWGEKLVALMG
ncbi:ser thr phosphatase family isoform A [Micractinium conductrix]|uniref:Ser thr phosphatase family isoform A n=1 Tax=Micractinium conductrix TaxID=554055 RepID=A0A2P6VS49_9CHLO|nr:ser thr phosphatase family isoform A [Micractinium conductrix]|eukprot:PSC76897.1 ser thr phosphatase family isoform A [Micractinium conductrix]